MKESTRLHARAVPSLLLALVALAVYLRDGGLPWVLLAVITCALAIPALIRARSVGDAEAPAIGDRRLVARVSTICGALGACLLLVMLWRAGLQWTRLAEPGNLLLGGIVVMLLGAAVYAPLELTRRAPARPGVTSNPSSTSRGMR